MFFIAEENIENRYCVFLLKKRRNTKRSIKKNQKTKLSNELNFKKIIPKFDCYLLLICLTSVTKTKLK